MHRAVISPDNIGPTFIFVFQRSRQSRNVRSGKNSEMA